MPLARPRRGRQVAGIGALVSAVALARLRTTSRRRVDGPAGGVRTDDGTLLHVEVDDEASTDLTVVFVHGFTARLEEFVLQQDTLRSRARLVLYDQRGHGRSGWGDVRNATIDQLGRDLLAVLDAHAPDGPVVLVGHSMGGMTVMALARQRPDLFEGGRVAGVLLLATSAGEVVSDGVLGAVTRLGRRLHLLPLWLTALQVVSPLLERGRRPGTRIGYAFTRRYLFGADDAGDRKTVQVVQDLLEMTPFTITAAFYPTFVEHDELAALQHLHQVPVTVLVGSTDRLTPLAHSRRMIAELGPDAELVVVPGAGHSVNITRQAVVDGALLALLDRARADWDGRRQAAG